MYLGEERGIPGVSFKKGIMHVTLVQSAFKFVPIDSILFLQNKYIYLKKSNREEKNLR